MPAAIDCDAGWVDGFGRIEGEEACALIAKVELEDDGFARVPEALGGAEAALESLGFGAPGGSGSGRGLGSDKRGLHILGAAGGEQSEQGEGQSSGVSDFLHRHPSDD
jgi:hypothetical protein